MILLYTFKQEYPIKFYLPLFLMKANPKNWATF